MEDKKKNQEKEIKQEEVKKETCETVSEKEDNKIEELQKQIEEYKDKWMRNVAEFDNYKKRNAKLWQDAFNEGISSVITKVLPIGDSLDRACDMGLDDKTEEGIKGLIKKFNEALKSIGIEEINPVGEQFDPTISEALMQVEKAEGETADTVKQVFEKGYKLNDKIIRYAKVSVIK